MSAPPTRDLTRTTLALLFLGGLLLATFWILRPFLAPLIWATLLVIATWPVLCRTQALFGGRRGLAVTAMMAVLLAVFIVPFLLAIGVLVENAPEVVAWVKQLSAEPMGLAPEWLRDLPLIGTSLADTWNQVAEHGPEVLKEHVTPYVDDFAKWFVAQVGGAGLLFIHFLLTLVLVGVLYAKGEPCSIYIRRFASRLAGSRGDQAVVLAANAIRGVAYGVVVTALIQSAVGGLGLAIAGVPAAAILTGVMFVTSVAQIGAAPILALSAVWLFVQGHIGWGIAMIVWTVVVGSLDNIVRPILIRKGADMPLVLAFTGVIGGLIAFGAVGLFAGPAVLAVGHALLTAWVDEGEPVEAVPTT